MRFSSPTCRFLFVAAAIAVASAANSQNPPAPTKTAALPPPPSWAVLKAAYAYTAPVPTITEQVRADPEYRLSHIVFTNRKGQSVPGLFLRPRADGVYPCVLLLHGLGSDKETMTRIFGRALAAKGIASLALDADLHGERKNPDQAKKLGVAAFTMVMNGGIFDYRQALDYLTTRKDVDSHRIGLLGYSMGAMMGAILTGVDARIKASVLCVGGDPVRPFVAVVPEALRPAVEDISPSNYIGHISPRPVYMINGTKDTTMKEDASRLMQDAAREPKQIVWADSGHILPLPVALKGVDWLAGKL